jgi:hypothetical protein
MNSYENVVPLCLNKDFSSISVAVNHRSESHRRVPSCQTLAVVSYETLSVLLDTSSASSSGSYQRLNLFDTKQQSFKSKKYIDLSYKSPNENKKSEFSSFHFCTKICNCDHYLFWRMWIRRILCRHCLQKHVNKRQIQDKRRRGKIRICWTTLRKRDGKAIPLQIWTGPAACSRLRFPDFKITGS